MLVKKKYICKSTMLQEFFTLFCSNYHQTYLIFYHMGVTRKLLMYEGGKCERAVAKHPETVFLQHHDNYEYKINASDILHWRK